MACAKPASRQETLEAAETRCDALRDRLEMARADLASLGASIDKARDAYRDELARAELDGGAAPSRSALSDQQVLLPAAEDRVAAFARALAEADGEWRRAKADVLDAQAAALEAESAKRESLARVLREQIAALQRQIDEHYDFIRNNAGVRPMQLQAEARRLRSAP